MAVVKTYNLNLGARDLGQLLDSLEIRAETWEKTAVYLRMGKLPHGELFLIEECNCPDEAEQIAEHYRSIIQKIREQMGEQSV